MRRERAELCPRPGPAFGLTPQTASFPGFHMGGLIMSTIGALFVLGLFVAYAKRTDA